MNDDILKSVSQGGDGTQDAENCRIATLADELQRLCQLHEAQSGTGKTDVTPFEREQVNNLMNSGCIVELLHKVLMHNQLFPDTAYQFHGFAGFDGRTVQPVLRQARVANARPATQIIIDTYMAALGFEKRGDEGHFTNGQFEVWDVVPRNVLIDADGDIFVIDAEIKHV